MHENDKKPDMHKRIGEFLILSIYLFAETWEFWNVNHLLTLFLAWLGILALLMYDGTLNTRRLSGVAIGLGIAAIVIDLLAPPILLPETETHGWLLPANDPSAETACPPNWDGFVAGVLPNKTVTVALGRTGVVIPAYSDAKKAISKFYA